MEPGTIALDLSRPLASSGPQWAAVGRPGVGTGHSQITKNPRFLYNDSGVAILKVFSFFCHSFFINYANKASFKYFFLEYLINKIPILYFVDIAAYVFSSC